MKKKQTMTGGVLLLCLFLSSCQLYLSNTEAMIETKVAEAVDEKISEIDESGQMEDQKLVDTPVPIAIPSPTYTPLPTQESLIFYDYSYIIGTPGGCLNAAFISETVPDNTVFSPNDGFIKSWTIKNMGYCNWNTNYSLVFLSGDAMNGDLIRNLPGTVSPGASITLNTNLTAPASEGTYRGEWRIQSDLGLNFARFWVQIVVED